MGKSEPFRSFKNSVQSSMHVFKKYTSHCLPVMCILPHRRSWFVYFGFVIVYLPQADLYVFYVYTQHQMIEVARWDEDGMLVHGQLGSRHSDVTSTLHRGPNQPIRSMVEYSCSKCWWSSFGLPTDVHDVSTKLHEASWSHREVVLRTGFTCSLMDCLEKWQPEYTIYVIIFTRFSEHATKGKKSRREV